METKFPGYDFRAKITLADKERHNKYAGGGSLCKHFLDMGFLLPESRLNLAKNPAPAQFFNVLVHRCGGLIIQRCPMSEHNQRGIGEINVIHPCS